MDSLKEKLSFKNTISKDIKAGIVVFFVALPLCLGIALASGAPPLAGLISGIIGGVIVGSISGSALGVSGPAAGLAIIVLTAIDDLGGFEIFLVAVVLAGIIQFLFGIIRGGFIAYYFPSSVIHGMLAGIGIMISLKQIPHLLGYDKDPVGDDEFFQPDHENTFSELFKALENLSPGVVIVSLIGIAILLLWESKKIKNNKILSFVPGSLIVVIIGIILNLSFLGTGFEINSEHLVTIPESSGFQDFLNNFTLPEFSHIWEKDIWITAIVIAVVASLETLLSVEATDKQDPLKRITNTNLELKAQGIGNLISGLPITQVIVRSSANMQSGGMTKKSAIFHGVLLLLAVALLAPVLNLIPLGALAALLLIVGYKLAKPSRFIEMYKQGYEQFIPFLATIIVMIATDLLIGVSVGLGIAMVSILYKNFKIAYTVEKHKTSAGEKMIVKLPTDVTFLNKASMMRLFEEIPENTEVFLDCSQTKFIHYDVQEIIDDFKVNAENRKIKLNFTGLHEMKS